MYDLYISKKDKNFLNILKLKFMSENKKNILLAEDDRFISKAYKAGLEKAGFEVIPAYDGVEALKKIKEKEPDLVLLDIVMPEKNGFEVLEEMKMNKGMKNIPVVIISNLGQESDIKKGKELGVLDYLVKTDHSMKEVVEKVKYCLSKK